MLKNIISVMITTCRFMLLKLFKGNCFFYHGIQRFSPSTEIELEKGSKLVLGRKVRAHSGTKIKVRNKAEVTIGDDVAFNYNCMIVSRDRISIGNGCEIGPGVLLYDHDHDIKNHLLKDGEYLSSPIEIGENVWIGANVVILRGTKIGDNSVIGAGAIIKGEFPANSVIIQKVDYEIKKSKYNVFSM